LLWISFHLTIIFLIGERKVIGLPIILIITRPRVEGLVTHTWVATNYLQAPVLDHY